MEMGVGTVTVRVMCDDLRANADPLLNGFPLPADLAAVAALLDTVRPVTVKELYVCAPIPQPIAFTVANLEPSPGTSLLAAQASLATSVAAMLARRARPSTALNDPGADDFRRRGVGRHLRRRRRRRLRPHDGRRGDGQQRLHGGAGSELDHLQLSGPVHG